MNVETLEEFGLTKGESKVYLTLLKVGNTTSGKLIENSGVSRSKVYDVLNRLNEKGLVAESIKNGVRHFESTNPKKIVEYLEEKKNDYDEKIKSSKKVVQDLERLRSSGLDGQEAKVYVGIEGIKSVYSEILNSLSSIDEYLAFGLDFEGLKNEKLNLFIKNFHLKRAEKKVSARILLQKETKEMVKDFLDLKYYKYKFIEQYFPTNIAICGDKVLIVVSDSNPVAFEITSKQVSKKFRAYFELLWKVGKK